MQREFGEMKKRIRHLIAIGLLLTLLGGFVRYRSGELATQRYQLQDSQTGTLLPRSYTDESLKAMYREVGLVTLLVGVAFLLIAANHWVTASDELTERRQSPERRDGRGMTNKER